MDGEEPTQATQNVLDPRRVGKQNSGFSDEDISDIICVLYPHSDSARQEVQHLALEGSPYIIGREEADGVEPNYDLEDHASNFDSNLGDTSSYAIILRLSSAVKDPAGGYAFGRNTSRCDVVFANDPHKRVSNIHFRIYVNKYGNVMIEDQSTNGTFVDRQLLTSRPKDNTRPPDTKWVLSSGSIIKIYLHQQVRDLTFRVRIPRRDDEYEQAYAAKVAAYRARHGLDGFSAAAAAAAANNHNGPVDIFKTPGKPLAHQRVQAEQAEATAQQQPRSPSKTRTQRRDWNGSGKYNRVGTVGKGAFAVVYKVTGKYDGRPYAAKELEKRRFIKNGVLDQKVENEMKIMERVQHPNIVRYIENFDWEDRLLIIIMEYIPGGDLGRVISDDGPLTEDMAQTMTRQLLGALEYLHLNSITHRDVKPDNILVNSIDPLEVKLTDFGLSKMVDSEQTFLRTFCGTLLYCAPEVYTEYAEYDDNGFRNRGKKVRRMPGQRYNHAIDIWSLGGVLFFSLTASPPYPVKSGISYSELLHKIMTTRLDVTPLQKYGISQQGIDFICRMLQRRPESRATIKELDTHPWFGGQESIIDASQSYDEITDDDDLAAYSQQQPWGDEEEEEDRVSDSMGEEDDENNDAQRQQPQRLFGEIGASAIGSSGVIPDDFLDFPGSIRETDMLDSQYEDDADGSRAAATPAATRTYRPGDGQNAASAYPGQSADQLQSLVENVASQSLGGHGKTDRDEVASSQYYSMDFATSKRKPASHDTSDEHDGDMAPGKPVMKRLKSVGNIEEMTDDFADEARLLACVPPIRRLGSGRQIDEPVDKEVYWEKDRSTWHLDYPEMTQLQYSAFQEAAKSRGEVFGPEKSPLWGLAMRHFPSTTEAVVSQGITMVQTDMDVHRADAIPTQTQFPATAMPTDEMSTPHNLPPDAPIVVPVNKEGRAVGLIESHANSCVPGISFTIEDPFVSFGRHPENTEVFHNSAEPHVPKFAFKMLLWKDGYDPSRHSSKVPYPWTGPSTGNDDQYAFWISTKATIGIRINDQNLPSDDPKNYSGPSRHWVRLHDGDDIIIWGNRGATSRTALTFRCFWGASSKPRADKGAPLEMASSEIAQKLDEACRNTEKRTRTSKEANRRRKEASDDLMRRKNMVGRERERSHAFEVKRQEAVAFLQTRPTLGSQGSTASAPAATGGALHGL